MVEPLDVPELDDPVLEDDELPLHMPLPVVELLPVVVGVVVVTAAGKNPVPVLEVELWVSSCESRA